MSGKSVSYLHRAIAMCAGRPNYKVACYFASSDSRKSMLNLAVEILNEHKLSATISFTTGNIEFSNGSVVMLRVAGCAVGDVAHKVESGSVSDWMKSYLKTRERL